jgi:hypothetical protein
LREKDGGEAPELFKEEKVLEHRQVHLPAGEVLVKGIPPADRPPP